MIFVTTGVTGGPFDRLLRGVEALDVDEELVVQHGPSALRPAGATCVAFLDFDELADLIATARVVVTHAGVGSLLVALAKGKHPIVVPRLARYGEAVDDHQLELAEHLAARNLVTLVTDPQQLPSAVRSLPSTTERRPADGQLVRELRSYLDQKVDAEGSARRGRRRPLYSQLPFRAFHGSSRR